MAIVVGAVVALMAANSVALIRSLLRPERSAQHPQT
jgi:hypothetical protein